VYTTVGRQLTANDIGESVRRFHFILIFDHSFIPPPTSAQKDLEIDHAGGKLFFMVSSTNPVGEAPVLETERLRLRSHRISDFPQACAMWGDLQVTRFLGGRSFSKEEVWARLLRYVGHWCWLGYGYWALEEKSSGEFIGEAGFADFQREIDPPMEGIPDLGWILATRAHGRGYATEAAQAMIAWGDRHLSFSRILCLVHPENQASLRVADKCGFRDPNLGSYKGSPTVILTRER